jgi:hypothetical protein
MQLAKICWVCLVVVTTGCFASLANAEEKKEDRRAQARAAATEHRREWLRKRLTSSLRNPQQIQHVNAKIDRMSAEQIQELAARYLSLQQDKQQAEKEEQQELDQANQNLAKAKAVRDELRRLVESRRGAGGRAGFSPVITWLPEGASLTASAVVSPDRRYVRINAMPFFSSIGPVHTFNFGTGETRRLRQFDPPPRPAARAETWHDGLRTRVGPRPGQ